MNTAETARGRAAGPAVQPSDVPETLAWCREREHPSVTHNPWLDVTLCRCGQRQEAGEQPMDWSAKREVFHSCEPGSACRCRLS